MTSVVGDTNPDTPTSENLGAATNNNGTIENGKSEETVSNSGASTISAQDILLPTQIKREDIDGVSSRNNNNNRRMPIISLTPTSKLLATPNPTDPKRKFVCPYNNCGKSYGKSSHLRSHLTWHTGIKPFVCQELNCGKGFTRSDELNRHIRTHTGEKPFECMQCMKKFSRSDHLTKHLATHDKQQKSRKRTVNVANDTNVQNALDARSDSPVPVRIPSPKISTRQSKPKRMLLEMNNRSGHDMGAVPSNDKEQQDQNPDIFSAKELFKDHFKGNSDGTDGGSDEEVQTTGNSFVHVPIKIKLERPENSKEYQIVPTSILKNLSTLDKNGLNDDDTEKEELICGGDDEIMPEANVPDSFPLDVIIKDEPIDADVDRVHSCEICMKTFRRESDLNRHKHVHSEDRRSSSSASSTSSITGGQHQPTEMNGSNDTSSNQSTKDPNRPFSCKECAKAFRRQDDLNRHMRTHTGEKPYACNECDRRFIRSDHLKKHLQTHIRLR